MKKLIAIILAALFLTAAVILSLAACGSGSTASGETTKAEDSTAAENTTEESTNVEDSFADNLEHYTKYADYTPQKAEPQEMIKGENSNILIAYFSRSGNTATGSDVDVVSSASLTVSEDGTTLGNAQQMAEWLAGETGGDMFLIQTEYTYPVDYDQVVAVGEGQDKEGYHPTLISHVENMEQYDTIYLVYPIWHYTLSVPTCAFLDEYDLSGKTIYAFAANGGSRFADSIERIQEAEPDAVVIEGISISAKEMEDGKEAIQKFFKENAANEISADESDENTEDTAEQAQEKCLKLMIGDTEVAVEWEDNESVEALKEMASENPLSISMSMYGGFEQVGSLGTTLTSSDVQTTTSAGDIVLYSSSQIVIFYGSNSWAYTRLGRITDKSAAELTDLLGNGNVTITISMK